MATVEHREPGERRLRIGRTFAEEDAADMPDAAFDVAKVALPSFAQAFRTGDRLKVTVSSPGRDFGTWSFETIGDDGTPRDISRGGARASPSRGRGVAWHRRGAGAGSGLPVAAGPGLLCLRAADQRCCLRRMNATDATARDERRTGNRRGRETRQRVLEAASRCFQERGMALTLDDVAQAAGTTRMTVHRHSGGREAPITHLMLRESARLADGLRAVLDAEGPFGQGLVDALVFTVVSIRAADHLQELFAGRTSTAAWPTVDPDDRVVAAIHGFFQPYFADAADGGLLRAEPDATLDWVLSQVLFYLVLPVTDADADAVRTTLKMFVLPSVLLV